MLDRAKFIILYGNELNNPTWVAEYLTREDVESEAVSRARSDIGANLVTLDFLG